MAARRQAPSHQWADWGWASARRWGWAAAAIVALVAVTLLASPPASVEQAELPDIKPPAAPPVATLPPVVTPFPDATRAAAPESTSTGAVHAQYRTPTMQSFPLGWRTRRAATSPLSIHVMHYHRVGHCVGRLVALPRRYGVCPRQQTEQRGVRPQGTTEFVHVLQDDTLTIKSSTRTYRFNAVAGNRSKRAHARRIRCAHHALALNRVPHGVRLRRLAAMRSTACSEECAARRLRPTGALTPPS